MIVDVPKHIICLSESKKLSISNSFKMLELYASAGIKKRSLFESYQKWVHLVFFVLKRCFYAFVKNKALIIEHWVFIKSDGAFPAMVTPIE